MRKMMKKSFAVTLLLAMLIGTLGGCGTTADKTSNAGNSTAADAGNNTADSENATPTTTESATTDTTVTETPVEQETLDTFRFVATEPNTLNMIESTSNLDTYVFYLTSAMLYRSIDGVVTPEVCDTLTVSDDRMTYTYTIKEATYSDGTKITADDFVYYLVKKYLTSENCTYFVGGEDTYNNSLETCEGIYSVDESTFVITMTSPIVTFNGQLEIYPLQKAFVEAKGEALGGTPADLLYSGPYLLTDWVVGSSMTFVKNDSYINADTLFPTQNLTLVVSSDASTTYSMYQNGEVDAIINVNKDLYELIDQADCTYYSADSLWGIEYNTTGFTYTDGDGFVSRGDEVSALMKNLNFRKALSYAINRSAVAAVVDPTSTVADRYVSTSVKGTGDAAYVDEYTLENTAPLEGDAEAAVGYLNAALAELGYSDVSQLPELSFLTFDSASQSMYVETVVSLWKSVLGLENVTINLQPIQSAIMSMVYMNYDIYLQQLSMNPDDMLEQLGFWKTTGGVSDVAGFQASGVPSFMASMHADEAYDTLVTDAYTEFDDAARFSMVQQAEQLLYDSYTFFPAMAGGGYYATKSYVEGYYSTYGENGYGFANLVVYAH